MSDQLIIKALEFPGHVGITEEERQEPQPIGVDVELDYPEEGMARATATDDILHAVDYASVAARVTELGAGQPYALLETLADRLANMLFSEFPVSGVRLWVRKLSPPVRNVRGSVGIRLDRHRPSPLPVSAQPSLQLFTELVPARFLTDHVDQLKKGDTLDLAAGRGRNALYLATQGFNVEAVDWDEQALAALQEVARERNLPTLRVRTVDLESQPNLPKEQYDTILVFFYLQRDLFPSMINALKPGGVLMYETFLIDNHLRRSHPRRREFCLGHNELLRLVGGLRVLHYEEGEHEGAHGAEPAFTARLIARKD